ncbi:phage tail tip lysozyme, partial [Dialister succinatiphilus]|uniref:phage tail tip lysozyme n=1 Tax=Dialister succinatiphilus TaxID=487173 RepID=UPI003FF0087D
MYDPFEGIEPAENQTNNAGSSDGSGVYDPFGEIEPYKPPEETSFLDKVKSFGQKVYEQADRTTTNIENALPNYIGKVEKAADAYGQEVSQAATRAYEARAGGEDINDEDPTSGYEGQNYDTAKAGLYDAAVGTPAGYVAITPFVPAPVRGAAGLLAAPTIVNGTMNAYDQNVANDDGTPVVSTAKQTLLDPVIDPVKEAVTQPGKYVQEIVDNPLNVWDKVFLPASMVEGAVKGGEKLVPDRVKEKAKAKMDSAVDTMDALGRDLRGEDVSRGGATGFDDLANNGEGVKAMRSDVYDPFGDVEPASHGGSTGFDDLARASSDNAASYDAPPADVSAPVFNVAGDADWAGMNDSTKAAANELVARWNQAHPEAPVTMTSGKRSGNGTSHYDVGEAVDFVSDAFEGEAGRPLRDEFGRMASDMGLTPFDEYNGSGNEAYARGENFHVTVPRDWQGSGRSVADMADDGGYGFDDGMRDVSDVADDADGGMYEETGDMATDVYNRYRQDGLTDAEAAGMTGNIAQESDFNAGAVSSDGYGTRALIQWDGDRYARFEKWCEDNGRDPSDWRAQVDYSVEEMKTTEPDALRRMRERGDDLTPEEAAQIIREDYERPDPAQANDARRMSEARRVYDQGGSRQNAPIDDGETSRSSGGEDGVIETGDRGGNLNFDESAPSDRVQAMRDAYDPVQDRKAKQLDLILKNNPANDDVHLWIRSTKDIHTAEEVFKEAYDNGEAMYPDFTLDMMDESLKSGKVTVYSSHPIKDGIFVTPSYMNARDYSGGGRVYSKKIRLTDVAWIDESEGQYAPVKVSRTSNGRIQAMRDTSRPVGQADLSPRLKEGTAPRDVPREYNLSGEGNAQTIQRMDTIRSMRNDVDYTAHEDSGVPVTRQGIVDYVNRLFNATVRYGRTEKGARGQFNTLSHVIRTQNFAEPRVIAHELGHFLDERFHFSEAPEYASELLHLVDDRFGKGGYSDLDMSGRLAEGFAEFFHDYVTDRAQARRNAPEFYNYFEKKLHQDPKLTGATNKLTDVMYKWNHQGAVARVKGHISFASDSTGFQGLKRMLQDGTFGEAGKKAWSRLYTEAVDGLHPLADVVAAVEKRIGKKLPFSSNPFLNAWAARGWAGKAITLLQHGDPERGIPALKDIFHSVGKKNLKDFSAFLVALREKDIYDFNSKLKKGEEGSALKATMDPIDAGMTIRELAKKHP